MCIMPEIEDKNLREAVLTACEGIREGENPRLAIWKAASDYGYDTSEVARYVGKAGANAKKERGSVNYKTTSVRLDMSKVMALAGKRNIENAGREIGLGHDTIKIIMGREGNGVRRSTAQKIAEWLGTVTNTEVSIADIEWKENGQMVLPCEPTPEAKAAPVVETGISKTVVLTDTERKLLAMLSIWNGIPEDEILHKIVTKYLKKVAAGWCRFGDDKKGEETKA